MYVCAPCHPLMPAPLVRAQRTVVSSNKEEYISVAYRARCLHFLNTNATGGTFLQPWCLHRTSGLGSALEDYIFFSRPGTARPCKLRNKNPGLMATSWGV
jgi:hypothetical protein